MTLSFVQLLTPAWSLLHSKTSSLLDTMICLFVVPNTHESIQKHMDKTNLAHNVPPKQQFATLSLGDFMSWSSKPFIGLFTQGSLGGNQYRTGLLPFPISASPHHLRIQQTNKARLCWYFFKGLRCRQPCGSHPKKRRRTRENGRNVKSILRWTAAEGLEARGARDGCLKPRILGGRWSSARLEGLATAAGSRRYWRKRPTKGPCRGRVMDFVGRAAGLDKTGCWNDSRGTQGRRSWGVYPAC